MELEYELNQKDSLRKHRAIGGYRIDYGYWTVVLLVVGSILQFVFLWFSDVLFQMPRLKPFSFVILLGGIGFFIFCVIANYRRRVNVPPLQVRIEFHDEYIYERSKNTEFQKAYASLERLDEDKSYFLIRQLGNVIVIPKRFLTAEQTSWISSELPKRIGNSLETTVPFYKESFGRNQDKTFRFRWMKEDFDHLNLAAFTSYNSETSLSDAGQKKPRVVSARLVLVLVVVPIAIILAMYSILESNLLVFPTLVVLIGIVVFNELAQMQQRRAKRFQTQNLLDRESEFYVSSKEVWIGQPGLVNRHALSDIINVCYSDHFVALQSNDRLLYVLPRRGIGSDETVIQFLESVQGSIQAVESVETGNPYQSPTL